MIELIMILSRTLSFEWFIFFLASTCKVPLVSVVLNFRNCTNYRSLQASSRIDRHAVRW